jgi:hypothetical protein
MDISYFRPFWDVALVITRKGMASTASGVSWQLRYERKLRSQ